MLQKIAKYCTINAVYTNGLDVHGGKESLSAIAVDTTPALSQSIIEILNNKFVPGYTEFSNIVDALNGATILLPVCFMNCSITDWVEIVGWESVLTNKASECYTQQRLDVYYSSVMNSLKLSAESASNELKLVYLYELLAASLFCKNTSISSLKVSDIQRAFPEYKQVIDILYNFRNAFVHSGFLTSYGEYLQLELHCKEQVESLAKQFDVELNWNYTIYSKGE